MSEQRPYGGVSADDRAALRRQRLLEAGLEVFGSSGYRTATVRQVCGQAKVADRYFYEEFRGLEELLVAVYERCLDTLEDAVTASIGTAQGVDAKARGGIEAFTEVVERDPRLARVVWFEVLGVSRRVETAYLDRMARFGELILAATPHLDDVDPKLRPMFADAVVGGVSHVFMTWVASEFARPRSEIVTAMERFLVALATGISALP